MLNFTASLTVKLKSWRVQFFKEIHENVIEGDCFVRKLKNPTFKKHKMNQINADWQFGINSNDVHFWYTKFWCI
jgi:hypothetical protein